MPNVRSNATPGCRSRRELEQVSANREAADQAAFLDEIQEPTRRPRAAEQAKLRAQYEAELQATQEWMDRSLEQFRQREQELFTY